MRHLSLAPGAPSAKHRLCQPWKGHLADVLERPLTLRSIAASVFLPALIFEIGNGAIAPIIALTALAEGASTAVAGFTLALLGVGQVLGDIPAGALADRVGDRRAMMMASGLAVVAQLVCLLSQS